MNIFGNHTRAARVLSTNEQEIKAGPVNDFYSTKRRIRVSVSVFYFFQGLCFASWASRIPYIKEHIGLTDGQMGSILFALPAGQLAMMPASGYLVNKYGSKNIVKFTLPLYSIALILLSLGQHAWQLALGLFFFGISGNMCNISVNTQGVNAEKMYHRPIMASFHGAWSSAGFTGGLVGLLMTYLHVIPTWHFAIISAITIVAVLFNYQYLVADSGSKIANDDKQAKKSLFAKPDPLILQLGIIGFFAMSCEGAMFDWSGVYFKDIVHAKDGLVTLGFTCFMTMMATGRFIGDKLVVRYGRKKLMQVCGVLIMTGLGIAVAFPYVPTAAFGFLLVGCGVSTNIPNVFSIAGEQNKMSPTTALAAVSSISYLGFLIGPPLIGYTSELLNLRLSYGLIAIFGLIITILVSKLKIIK